MTKTSSYKKVNYLLRLKKQIERKIIIEILQHLNSKVDDIDMSSYHYVGFGSIYFADFILFHKYLNIKNMTSIDDKKKDKNRFIFNKPFNFINFKVSHSCEFLRKHLKWSDKLLVWLDYDSSFSLSMIKDIEFFASKAKQNDILLITVVAESPEIDDLSDFEQTFRQYIPAKCKKKDIHDDFPKTLSSIMNACIQDGLKTQKDRIHVPFINISYADTKKMYTLGVIFCNKDCEQLWKMLLKMPFRMDKQVLDIDCPILSPKEKMYLDSLIEKDATILCDTKEMGLEKKEVKKYCKYYKYYPQFFESMY